MKHHIQTSLLHLVVPMKIWWIWLTKSKCCCNFQVLLKCPNGKKQNKSYIDLVYSHVTLLEVRISHPRILNLEKVLHDIIINYEIVQTKLPLCLPCQRKTLLCMNIALNFHTWHIWDVDCPCYKISRIQFITFRPNKSDIIVLDF